MEFPFAFFYIKGVGLFHWEAGGGVHQKEVSVVRMMLTVCDQPSGPCPRAGVGGPLIKGNAIRINLWDGLSPLRKLCVKLEASSQSRLDGHADCLVQRIRITQ